MDGSVLGSSTNPVHGRLMNWRDSWRGRKRWCSLREQSRVLSISAYSIRKVFCGDTTQTRLSNGAICFRWNLCLEPAVIFRISEDLGDSPNPQLWPHEGRVISSLAQESPEKSQGCQQLWRLWPPKKLQLNGAEVICSSTWLQTGSTPTTSTVSTATSMDSQDRPNDADRGLPGHQPLYGRVLSFREWKLYRTVPTVE